MDVIRVGRYEERLQFLPDSVQRTVNALWLGFDFLQGNSGFPLRDSGAHPDPDKI
jgi:hypothetical protein